MRNLTLSLGSVIDIIMTERQGGEAIVVRIKLKLHLGLGQVEEKSNNP